MTTPSVIAPEHLDANERFVMCMSEAGYPPDESYEATGYTNHMWRRPFPPRKVTEKARVLADADEDSCRIVDWMYDDRTNHSAFGVAVRKSEP